MKKRGPGRDLGALLLLLAAGLALWAISCSSLLDIEELQQGGGDGAPDIKIPDAKGRDGDMYPMSLLPRLPHEMPPQERMALTPTESGEKAIEVDFSWQDIPGRPADVDLSIEAPDSDTPLFQIFARQAQPFVRCGLSVYPISANQRYRLRLTLSPGEQPRLRLQILALTEQGTRPELETDLELPGKALIADYLRLSRGLTDHSAHRVSLGRISFPELKPQRQHVASLQLDRRLATTAIR